MMDLDICLRRFLTLLRDCDKVHIAMTLKIVYKVKGRELLLFSVLF